MVFVDTNVFVAALNRRDKLHERDRDLLQKAFTTFKWLYTSDYIFNECLLVAWARTRNTTLIQQLDKVIQESEKIEILKVDEPCFSTAKSYLRKHPKLISTLTDWASLVLMRDHKISNVLSFDIHFDKVRSIPEFSAINRISDASQII